MVTRASACASHPATSTGSPDIFGRTYVFEDAHAQQAIPLGLATGGKVLKDITKGDMLTETNFAPDSTKFVYELRKVQDAQLKMDA